MPRLLIIEDDPALLRGLKDNFVDEGYEVEIANDGAEGLDYALEHGADLILLDIMLPKINGYEICRSVRLEGYDMPIIMLTAKGQESDIIRGLEMGADDYVTKPFSIRELIARVKAFLRRHKSTDTEQFQFGNCTLDRQSCCCFKDGKDLGLTNKEYGLLEYFLLNAGKALTRTSIMNHVWGNSIMVTQRSVDRCVTTLRSKVEETPSKPEYIKTIRDVGYRFEL